MTVSHMNSFSAPKAELRCEPHGSWVLFDAAFRVFAQKSLNLYIAPSIAVLRMH